MSAGVGASMSARLSRDLTSAALWLFFAEDRQRQDISITDAKTTGPATRWRLLLWAMAAILLWEKLEVSCLNFVLVVAGVGTLSCILRLAFIGLPLSTSFLRTPVILALTTCLVSAVTLLTLTRCYLSYEYLVKKIILKECEMWSRGCPTMYIVVSSMTAITVLLRGALRGEARGPAGPSL